MRRKIAVITGTRAEYGLLRGIMAAIRHSCKLRLQVIVTGTHLSPEFGNTYQEIESDGFAIARKVNLDISGDSSLAISTAMGRGVAGFAKTYNYLKPDIILVLGDRYEILAAAAAAIPFNIPIAHIAGGEVTEGAMDEQIRHALTKMAHIHFPCAGHYARNIRRMGEEAWRIFSVGHPRMESLRKMRFINRKELFSLLGLDPDKKTFLSTLHPATLSSTAEIQSETNAFFDVLGGYNDVNIVLTYPNSDTHGKVIIRRIKALKGCRNIKVFRNLGDLKYLSLMRECDLVVGNSSSGIVDAPFFRVPVVDYGRRQKGRLMAANILHADANRKSLKYAIDAMSDKRAVAKRIRKMKYLYGNGNTSQSIVKVLENIEINRKLLTKILAVR